MSEHIQIERSGAVVTIRMARPEKKNALTGDDVHGDDVQGLRAARSDDPARRAMIAGAGGVFTSGNDLRDFAATPPTDADSPVLRFLREISTFRNRGRRGQGLAVGHWYDDAVALRPRRRRSGRHDSRCRSSISASCPRRRRVSVTSDAGTRACERIAAARRDIRCACGARYGIVNKLSAPGAAETRQCAWAQALAAKAPTALRLCKALIKSETTGGAGQHGRRVAGHFVRSFAAGIPGSGDGIHGEAVAPQF